MQFLRVELNGVRPYNSNMKFVRRILNLFKAQPKPDPLPSLAQLFADADRELEKENEAIVQILQAEWEEQVLTVGRPVILLPPSRTLH